MYIINWEGSLSKDFTEIKIEKSLDCPTGLKGHGNLDYTILPD